MEGVIVTPGRGETAYKQTNDRVKLDTPVRCRQARFGTEATEMN